MPPVLEIGRVVKPHGLKGDVVVELVTNRLERLAIGSQLRAAPGRLADAGVADPSLRRVVPPELVVQAARVHGKRHVVHFEGVESLEAAEMLRQAVLSAPAIEDPEALFVHDLVGSEVRELSGEVHGRVVSVQANPASDLLVLEDGTLVPLVFVVATEDHAVIVDAPSGLFS